MLVDLKNKHSYGRGWVKCKKSIEYKSHVLLNHLSSKPSVKTWIRKEEEKKKKGSKVVFFFPNAVPIMCGIFTAEQFPFPYRMRVHKYRLVKLQQSEETAEYIQTQITWLIAHRDVGWIFDWKWTSYFDPSLRSFFTLMEQVADGWSRAKTCMCIYLH